MTTSKRTKLAIGIPVLIFTVCIIISFSSKFNAHPETFSLAIIIDLLVVAPLLYFLLIRKTNVSVWSTIRVLTIGILIAGLILSKGNSQLLAFVKTWISPVVEFVVISLVIRKFYSFKKLNLKTKLPVTDFLCYCRLAIRSVIGNEKAANIIASEIAVFYYIFSKKTKPIKNLYLFTSYKKNGIILVLSTFLCLLLIETAGMHFLFRLWNGTIAWILTGLSAYTCLQLFAHIRAIKTRPTIIYSSALFIRNGTMGGDAFVAFTNIESIEKINKPLKGSHVVSTALIDSFEKPNLALHLKEPVQVIKAFGIKKMASTIIFSADEPVQLISCLENIQINM